MHREFRDEVRFVEVLVRQSHPGPGVEPYRDLTDKLRDGARYVRDEGLPWDVVVDDLPGSVHAAYGMLPDPAYLIGTDGRVSFYAYWTHVPTLRRALLALLARGGSGVIGEHRWPHAAAPLVGGWPAIARGLPQSADDLDRAALPGATALLRAGHAARGVLRPVALSSRGWARPALALVAVVAAVAGVAQLTRR